MTNTHLRKLSSLFLSFPIISGLGILFSPLNNATLCMNNIMQKSIAFGIFVEDVVVTSFIQIQQHLHKMTSFYTISPCYGLAIEFFPDLSSEMCITKYMTLHVSCNFVLTVYIPNVILEASGRHKTTCTFNCLTSGSEAPPITALTLPFFILTHEDVV